MKTASQIDAAIAAECGISKNKAHEILHSFTDLMLKEASEEGRIAYNGLIIKKVTRAARTGRNPRTGEALDIPEQDVLVFRKKIA